MQPTLTIARSTPQLQRSCCFPQSPPLSSPPSCHPPQVDDCFLPRGVPNFVVEGVLGDLQAAAARNLRRAETPGAAAAVVHGRLRLLRVPCALALA